MINEDFLQNSGKSTEIQQIIVGSGIDDQQSETPQNLILRSKIWFFICIIFAGILNTFVAPIIFFRFGMLTEFLIKGMWVLLLSAPLILPIEFIAASLVLALSIYLFFKKYKKFPGVFGFVLLSIVFFYFGRVFLAGALISSNQNAPYQNISAEKPFDSSGKVKLINTTSYKTQINLNDNSVSWLEQTRDDGDFGRKERNIIGFFFSENTKMAKTTIISDVSKEPEGLEIRSQAVNNEGIFWLQGADLYFQLNDISVARKVIKNGVGAIDSISNDNLLLEYADKGHEYSPKGLYLYNYKTGKENDLTNIGVDGVDMDDQSYSGQAPVKLSGNLFCYIVKNTALYKKDIAIYDIKTGNSEMRITANPFPEKSIKLDQYSKNFIKYNEIKTTNIYTQNRETTQLAKIFDLNLNKVILEGEDASGRLISDYLVDLKTTNSKTVLKRFNLITGQKDEMTLDSEGKNVVEWTANDKYVAYITTQEGAGHEIWLESIK